MAQSANVCAICGSGLFIILPVIILPLTSDQQNSIEASMTDLPVQNIVQHACSCPSLFTPNGTLSELYSFFSGYESGFQLMARMAGYKDGHHYYDSVKLTLEWINSQAGPDSAGNGISRFIEKHGSEESAIVAIYEFASRLPTNVHHGF